VRPRPGEAGFTLVEVMVALLIVATSIAALQAISNATLRSAVETNSLRIAKMLLRGKAEEVAAGVETGSGGSFDDQGFAGYTWDVAQATLQAGEEETVVQVTVSVHYPTLRGEDAATVATAEGTEDGPGVIRVTTFIDPPDAKLEPPQGPQGPQGP
jgi:type II secretion system protein I